MYNRDEVFYLDWRKKEKTNNQIQIKCKIDHTFMTFIFDKHPMGFINNEIMKNKNFTILISNESKKKKDDFCWSTNHD